MPDGQDARRAQEWIREMFAGLSPERRNQRSYSLTFVSKVLERSTNEVRALVESGVLSAGSTQSGRLVFSIDDLLKFASRVRQGAGPGSMTRSALEIPSVAAELAANVLAGGEPIEVVWQAPATSMLLAGGRLEPDPDGRWLLFRDLSTEAICTIEFAKDPRSRTVMRCPGCGDHRRRLYRAAETGLLLCHPCSGFRLPTEEELRRASALRETLGPPPGLPGAESPENPA